MANKEENAKFPLFILVDELDRCRPTYAIEMLERVKHLFNVDNVVFVLATDTDQLSSAIKAVYGAGFDSPRYLNRFFDQTYEFPEPAVGDFLGQLLRQSAIDVGRISLPPGQTVETYFAMVMDVFGLALRDAEQSFALLRNILTTWRFDKRLQVEAVACFHSSPHTNPAMLRFFHGSPASQPPNLA